MGLWSWLAVMFVGLWRNFRQFVTFGHSFRRCLALGVAAGCALNYLQSTLERVLVQPRNLMMWLIVMGITARLATLRLEKIKELKEAKNQPKETV